MQCKAHVFAISLLAASLPAFANTASDNIAWSARPVAAVTEQPECTAYSGRQVTQPGDANADPLMKLLKFAGTVAALGAMSMATKAGTTTAPNPCRRF
ncbi:hypothetical protein [Paraburkholderia ginsengisoli]|uniref:Uncharacterized protein n=1 Tax=Paraburkholderia ginsengisoli TaxID=311231 RepID=A0A7T4MZ96_9BURK|nr:hypothetical protein [Paraburkholderia ginsengisoli]QQC62369.1 hypothetical protein I6I06_08405 [Paraburkholderia ginsengisoli]